MPASKPTPIIETPVSGPHELYTALVWDIVYKSTPALATLDDQTFTIVQHAVEKAIVATCIAAHTVPNTPTTAAAPATSPASNSTQTPAPTGGSMWKPTFLPA